MKKQLETDNVDIKRQCERLKEQAFTKVRMSTIFSMLYDCMEYCRNTIIVQELLNWKLNCHELPLLLLT